MVFTHRDVDPTAFMVTNGNYIFLANTLCPVDPLFKADNFPLLIALVFVLNNRLFFSKAVFYIVSFPRYTFPGSDVYDRMVVIAKRPHFSIILTQ